MTTAESQTTALAVPRHGVIALTDAEPVPSDRGGQLRPDLGPLGPAEVAGRTVCSLVSPGTEIANTFAPPEGHPGTPLPWVPGYATVFRVEEVGSAVDHVGVGDVVFSFGSHRSRQREAADLVWSLPQGLDPFAAVFARLMAIPMAALSTTGARPGASVGVSGLGPVGHLAAVAFDLAGYEVHAWDPVDARRALLPASITAIPQAPEATRRRQFGGVEGLDLVLECSGHDGAALDGLRALRALGELVLIGTPWQPATDATAFEFVQEVFFKYATVRSGWEWQIPMTPEPFRRHSTSQNIRLALRWLAEGRIDTTVLAATYAPAQAQHVYDSLTARTLPTLSAIFDWRS